MDTAIDVKALRERLDWTQHDMARYLGVDRTVVSRMESGKPPSGPVRRLLGQLAAAYPAKREPAQ